MASKALTKEQKSIVNRQKSDTRKRERDKAQVAQVSSAVMAPVGAVAAAAADGFAEDGELLVGPVPVTPVVSVLAAVGGILMGGVAGSAVTGLGVGGLDGWLARKTHAAVLDRDSK